MNTRTYFNLSIIYVLLSQPFIIGAVFLPQNLGLFIKMILLAGLCTTGRTCVDKVGIKILVALFIYFLIQIFLNPYYTQQVLLVLPDITFIFLMFYKLKNNVKLLRKYHIFMIRFTLFVAMSIIVSKICFTYFPGTFSFKEIDNYPTYYNFFVGIINPGKDRPSWYFAEPSYSGFFLGLNLFFLFFHSFKKAKHKVLALMIVSYALYCTASMGSLVYVLCTIPFFIANAMHVNKSIIIIALFVIVAFLYIVSSTFDLFLIEQSYFDIASHGADNRQERMQNAETIIRNGGLVHLLFGNGLECVVLQYKEGISDAYHKILCEWGLIFFISFFVFIYRLTRKNIPYFAFLLFSYFSIIIHLSPIVIISCYMVYFNSLEKELKAELVSIE